MTIIRRVERFLKSRPVKGGASVCVAFSGGPDSTCLLSVLAKLAGKYRYKISAAYLDHGIRTIREREQEKRHVRAFARKLHVPLYTSAVAPGELEKKGREQGISLEEAARLARISFFNNLKEKHGFSYLLSGHTLDDQLETIVMRIFQGSGAQGLRGIAAERGWILRPLLHTSRREICAFLEENRITAFTDSTNTQSRFMRNKVRQRLLPLIREIFPGVGTSLGALSAKMNLINAYIKQQTSLALCWQKTEKGVKIDVKTFFETAAVLRMYSLYHEYQELMRGRSPRLKGALPFRFIAPLLGRRTAPGRKVHCRGHGVIFHEKGKSLFLERDIVGSEKKGYFMKVRVGVPFTLFDHTYIISQSKGKRSKTDEPVCFFDAPQVLPPLVVRTRIAGDRITCRFGSKRLKKLFNDWKAGSEEKDLIPVLVDGQGILAVLGGFFGYKNIVRATSDGRGKKGTAGLLVFSGCREQ